jgi:hypothetical protein
VHDPGDDSLWSTRHGPCYATPKAPGPRPAAEAARNQHAGLVVVTQDAADLLAGDLGQAVAANAATQISLDWSDDPRYDLNEEGDPGVMYQTVLNEASTP